MFAAVICEAILYQSVLYRQLMMDQCCVMSGAVQGQQRTIGGEAVGGRQVVERLHRQLCLFLPLTRLRLAFRRHTSDAMLKNNKYK